MPLTACILTFNEERNLPDCLASVSWADEILVVDSHSKDRTVEIATTAGARVVQRAWEGMNNQRAFAIQEAKHDWVLCLDADERVSKELREEVASAVARQDGVAGYEVSRHTWYLGRWIDHGGWYPDLKLRLFRREKARTVGTDPHDRIEVDGPVGRLNGELHHYTYRNFSQQIGTIDRFSETASRELFDGGERFRVWKLLLRPPLKFLECWVWKLGLLDGLPGLVIAVASAFNVFSRYVKLWEKERGLSEGGPWP
ncbi:MAG: glycosyltransferase family 2 protein [Planctomycetota bacterium]